MTGQERRRHKRTPVMLPVSIYAAGNKNAIQGTVKDISLGGAYIQCDHLFPSGNKLLIEFKFDGMELLHAQVTLSKEIMAQVPESLSEPSVVRWMRDLTERGFGIEFQNLSPESQEVLTKLIAYLEANHEPEKPSP